MGRGFVVMEVVHARCAGLDISKKDAKVCVRIAGAGRRKTVETVTTWASMTSQILALRPSARSSSTRFSSSVSSSVPSVSSARLLGRSMRSNGLARKGSARRVARAPGAPDLTTSGLVARAGCVR